MSRRVKSYLLVTRTLLYSNDRSGHCGKAFISLAVEYMGETGGAHAHANNCVCEVRVFGELRMTANRQAIADSE
jgi:hypothetical protein